MSHLSALTQILDAAFSRGQQYRVPDRRERAERTRGPCRPPPPRSCRSTAPWPGRRRVCPRSPRQRSVRRATDRSGARPRVGIFDSAVCGADTNAPCQGANTRRRDAVTRCRAGAKRRRAPRVGCITCWYPLGPGRHRVSCCPFVFWHYFRCSRHPA